MQREYQKRRYQENPEIHKKYQKERYLNHKEKIDIERLRISFNK